MNQFAAQSACVKLAVERKLWILDNFLTVAIVAAIIAAAGFISYMIMRQHKR